MYLRSGKSASNTTNRRKDRLVNVAIIPTCQMFDLTSRLKELSKSVNISDRPTFMPHTYRLVVIWQSLCLQWTSFYQIVSGCKPSMNEQHR